MKISENTTDKIFYTIILILFAFGIYLKFPSYILSLDSTSSFAISNVFIYQSISYLIIPTALFILFRIWSNKKSKYKEFFNILFFSFVFLVISFPFAYIILDLGRQLSKVNNVRIGSSDGWLAFIGSLLGGIITMIALIFTLRHEKNIREDDMKNRELEIAILSTPVLKLSLSSYVNNKVKILTVQNLSNNKYMFTFSGNFIVENISSNFALFKNVQIGNMKDITNKLNNNCIREFNIINLEILKNDLIPPQTSQEINFSLETEFNNFDSLTLDFIFVYSDFKNLNNYAVNSKFSIEFDVITVDELKQVY